MDDDFISSLDTPTNVFSSTDQYIEMKSILLLLSVYNFVGILHTRPQDDYNATSSIGSYNDTQDTDESNDTLVLEGSYSYLGLDGVNYILAYIADKFVKAPRKRSRLDNSYLPPSGPCVASLCGTGFG